ncbi:hypothetical protein OG824_31645 [Streptomyces prunicolor]|uniref:hypothetical protein n=1 Tax=Streptomyces prunicolor TaxID=67348 RepID=UPI002259C770|nr:hypothetical protein [Streptomyces prunicolor]MCX5239764.1 hypothetical protein [Streptomyces prunicolor]
MTDRHTVDTITADALNALYEQLEAAEETEAQRQLATAREALASATNRAASAEAQAKHWLAFIERFPNHMQFTFFRPDGTTEQLPCADWCYACRVENAETAIARVRALAEANTADGADGQPCDADTLWPSEILAVLDEADLLPAAAWTPPPPGDTREQLPDHILALLDIPPYTSTACETAELLTAATLVHPEHAEELRQWARRQRERCRINNKYTGVHCRHTGPAPSPAAVAETYDAEPPA